MKLLLLALSLFGASFAQFSETAQNTIVEIHNDLRSKVALGEVEIGGSQHSPATNMIKIRWSPASARTAQNYANTCPDAPSGLPNVGENLYFEYSKKKPTSLDKFGPNAANSWAEDFDIYGWNSVIFDQETQDSGIGYASQMVWARTGYIGCGVKNCGVDLNTFTQDYRIVVVCHYREMGNVIDDPIYEEGEVCTNCPAFRSCEEETGLCL
ncbi:hypothetical protein CAEBREN_29503 [Caenorhabditis brenneri]|uniref:SCP domain-containing protein n=1 Tax=Caenorhabditis brenneri TaxID=135651 RepID=G0MT68_CAEBE|nr:hypothetical protein CAEBREN_29503 [Caenorhabditis brenneri]